MRRRGFDRLPSSAISLDQHNIYLRVGGRPCHPVRRDPTPATPALDRWTGDEKMPMNVQLGDQLGHIFRGAVKPEMIGAEG
jgi:hypothetical protein